VDASQARAILTSLLSGTNSVGASDLHLRADTPPFVRIDGAMQRVNGPAMPAEQIEAIIEHTSTRKVDPKTAEWEYSFEEVTGTRYRGHVFLVNGQVALTIRVIRALVPGFQELRLPVAVKALTEKLPGLVLVTGPTGSGKTTTAASMLKHLAASAPCHIVTIEDPVEYRIITPTSCVSQREVGRDTHSYADGLRAAMREDPDVLFIGEIRDRTTLEVALQAAETGHLVISTFHTGSALQTVQRMWSMFGPEDQAPIRERIADGLRGIICQRLLPRAKVRGRILATEVLINGYATRDLLRDPTKLKTLPQVLERSGDKHMHTLDQSLAALIGDQLVEPAIALSQAAAPNDIRRNLNLAGAAA
jgi:twitching motility protein PilT